MSDQIDVALALYIDYDNLTTRQQQAGIIDVVTMALQNMPVVDTDARIRCDCRVYGGWYEEDQMTRLAQQVTAELQRGFPCLLPGRAASGQVIKIVTRAELAVSMLEEPTHHVFYTYRRKSVPSNIRIASAETAGCSQTQCALPQLRHILKKQRCPVLECNVSGTDLVYRHEQKIVDTMLTCDLLFAPQLGYSMVALVSGDDDFLPPLRSLILRGYPSLRLHPKPGHSRASYPANTPQLSEVDL